jgi:uncharacterized protein YegP (UPF0339 family)
MKFAIWWNNGTWYWTLHDGPHMLAKSARRYETKAQCLEGIMEFQREARTAPIAEQTDEQDLDNPKD